MHQRCANLDLDVNPDSRLFWLELDSNSDPKKRALERGASVSSVEVKYFTVSVVDLKNTVSSVDLV